MNIQDCPQFPPRPFLMQILDSRAKIYIFLWDRMDEMNIFRSTWRELNKYFNKNTFRTSLRELNDYGLINYEETDEAVSIELVDWNEVSQD